MPIHGIFNVENVSEVKRTVHIVENTPQQPGSPEQLNQIKDNGKQ